MFICFAGILASISSSLLSTPVDFIPANCILRSWTVVLSAVSILAALFTRTYRLHRIFNNKSLRKVGGRVLTHEDMRRV